MRRSNFALRHEPSLLDELRKIAETESVALIELINVGIAEKLSALRREDYFAERGGDGRLGALQSGLFSLLLL